MLPVSLTKRQTCLFERGPCPRNLFLEEASEGDADPFRVDVVKPKQKVRTVPATTQ